MLRRRDNNQYKVGSTNLTPAVPSSNMAEQQESVIGPDDFSSGSYKFAHGVRIQGRVEGSIESRGSILIEQDAQVNADISAAEIIVAGRYDGKAKCRARFRITATGMVTGEINTNILVVEEGGYFDGEFKMWKPIIPDFDNDW